jgi:hypothetical protein
MISAGPLAVPPPMRENMRQIFATGDMLANGSAAKSNFGDCRASAVLAS